MQTTLKKNVLLLAENLARIDNPDDSSDILIDLTVFWPIVLPFRKCEIERGWTLAGNSYVRWSSDGKIHRLPPHRFPSSIIGERSSKDRE